MWYNLKYPLKIKITQFPGRFRLNASSLKAIQKKVVYQNQPSYFIQFKVCSYLKQLWISSFLVSSIKGCDLQLQQL